MSLTERGPDAASARRSGNRVVAAGLAAIVAILGVAAVLLFVNLPNGRAFIERVDKIFVDYDLTTVESDSETKLLGILADSVGTFSDVLVSYRMVIFVLMVFSTALLIASSQIRRT